MGCPTCKQTAILCGQKLQEQSNFISIAFNREFEKYQTVA
jgi:hypothetical protein